MGGGGHRGECSGEVGGDAGLEAVLGEDVVGGVSFSVSK